MASTQTQTTSSKTTLKASDDTAAATASSVSPNASVKEEPQQEQEDEVYDEIEIEDMTYDSTLQIYHYPCPCGDRFEIAVADLRDGQDIAVCPGCALTIRVVFDEGDLPEEAP